MGVQKHYKNILQKNRVEKLLKKIRPKIQNRFFLDFFITFFGRFSGSSKTRQKTSKHKSDPGPFLASDPPTRPRGSPFFFFGGPLSPGGLLAPGPAAVCACGLWPFFGCFFAVFLRLKPPVATIQAAYKAAACLAICIAHCHAWCLLPKSKN
jgi:hypothetical protein